MARALGEFERFVLLGVAAIAAACSSSTNNGTSTMFEGVIAGDSASGQLSGQISLTVATTSLSLGSPAQFDIAGTEAAVTVMGTLKIQGGGAITLSGGYDTNARELVVTGGGYTFTGTFTGGGISGSFTTPDVGGGSFATTSTSGGGAVYPFCGTAGGATFNLVINTGARTAQGYAGSDDGVTGLNGGATSSAWSIGFTTVRRGYPGTASGTFTSSSLTGTYSIPAQSDSGTVSATICH